MKGNASHNPSARKCNKSKMCRHHAWLAHRFIWLLKIGRLMTECISVATTVFLPITQLTWRPWYLLLKKLKTFKHVYLSKINMENIWKTNLEILMNTHPRLKRLETPNEVFTKLKDRFLIKVV